MPDCAGQPQNDNAEKNVHPSALEYTNYVSENLFYDHTIWDPNCIHFLGHNVDTEYSQANYIGHCNIFTNVTDEQRVFNSINNETLFILLSLSDMHLKGHENETEREYKFLSFYSWLSWPPLRFQYWRVYDLARRFLKPLWGLWAISLFFHECWRIKTILFE